MLRYLKTIIILPLFTFCLFIISSCGIENIPKLNPPTVIRFPSAGDNNFYFSATEDNNEIYFKGFELYYKFYRQGDTIEADDSNLEDSLGNDIITNHGFHRIYSSLDSSTETYSKPPLIPIEQLYRGTNYDIVIHFDTLFSSPISEPYVELSFSSEHIELRRDVMDTIYGLKKFSYFANGDSDLPDDILDISKSDELDVILYAASYGYDLTTGAVYSKCKYLGLITLDLNTIRGS